MPPRRKTKKAAAADTDAEAEAASQGTSPPPHDPGPSSQQSSFSISALPEDVDIHLLAEILPGVSFEAPSPEAIVNCYKLLLAQREQLDASSRDVEDLRALAEKKDVELDQALQDRESAVRDLETTVETVQSELNVIRKERDGFGEQVEFMAYDAVG